MVVFIKRRKKKQKKILRGLYLELNKQDLADGEKSDISKAELDLGKTLQSGTDDKHVIPHGRQLS